MSYLQTTARVKRAKTCYLSCTLSICVRQCSPREALRSPYLRGPRLLHLSTIPFAGPGQFDIPAPPSSLPCMPWEGFKTLKEARLRAQWVEQTAALCGAAPRKALEAPVCINMPCGARSALPVLSRWLRDAGFCESPEGFRSPLYHPNSPPC